MTAIQNIRRDIETAAYLAFSAEPFAGAVHNFRKPLAERLKSREHVGPYYWTPAAPGGGRGFYQSSNGLACDRAGSIFDLRLEAANDHLQNSRLYTIEGYFCDVHQDETLQPIVARLPNRRGFLAGWTMGAGICATIELEIYSDIEDAARAAHSLAERDAEREREIAELDHLEDA